MARLPAFEEGRHVPTLALINPMSGAAAGLDILQVAKRTDYYKARFAKSRLKDALKPI